METISFIRMISAFTLFRSREGGGGEKKKSTSLDDDIDDNPTINELVVNCGSTIHHKILHGFTLSTKTSSYNLKSTDNHRQRPESSLEKHINRTIFS